jgi:hypothetical protein
VPKRCQRDIPEHVSYPENARYTLQWIVEPPDKFTARQIPSNNDATFKDHNLPKPADLLLHYNYGAAAVKHWGKNVSVLTGRPNIPRPRVPAQAPTGLAKTLHDRNVAIGKRDDYAKRKRGEAEAEAEAEAEGGEWTGGLGKKRRYGVDLEPESAEIWDEDDVMLFFWGNSQAAQERHSHKEEEQKKKLEEWRAGVSKAQPV